MWRLYNYWIKYKTVILDRLIKLFAVLLLSNNIVFAQNQNSFKSKENLLLQTNATTFVTGEQLLYNIHCEPNNSTNICSKIVYVELVDSDKKSIFKQKLFLKNQQSSGYFTIPMQLNTGIYKLLSYTNILFENNVANVEAVTITILNPYVTGTDSKIKTSNETIEDKKLEATTMTVLSKNSFAKREKVSLNLQSLASTFPNKSVSISVRKKDALDAQYQTNTTSSYNSIKLVGNTPIAELRGEIIVGKISPKIATASIANKNISLSVPGNRNTVKITKTNAKGEFYFLLEEPFYTNNILIQCIDEDKESYKLELNNSSIDYSDVSFPNELILPVGLKDALEKRLIASQIENSYYTKKQDSIVKTAITVPFYQPFTKEFLLDDFTRFPTLQETIIEIIDGLTLKKQKENYQFYLKDYDENTNLEVPSLVLVDGLYIQDLKELLDYKADIFSKISTVKGGYYYGSKLFNGIIALTTKENNYETKLSGDFIIRPNLLRPLPERICYAPKYDSNSNLAKIPDYRYQLYWNTTAALSETPIEFFTSDLDGIFEIKVQGYNDKNEYVEKTEYFEVK